MNVGLRDIAAYPLRQAIIFRDTRRLLLKRFPHSTDDELREAGARRGIAVTPFARTGVFAGVGVTFAKNFGELGHALEILVVAIVLVGKQHVKTMMKIVPPLGLKSEAAGRLRADNAGVVQITFGD